MNQLTSSLPVLRILHDQDLEALIQFSHRSTYAPNTLLIQSGTAIDHIFLRLTGQLAASWANYEHSELFSVGELAGATSLLSDQPALISILAEQSSEVLAIPKARLKTELSRDRGFAARFYQLLAINLSEYLRDLSTSLVHRQIREGEPLRKVLMFFATLNDADIAWMMANGSAEKSTAGTILIQQGQPVPAVYLLLDGTVGIDISIAGQTRELAKRGKGDILGEISFVDGGVASASVRAVDETWVLRISQAQLAMKLQEDAAFAGRFYQATAQVLSSRCQDLLIRSGIASAAIAQDAEELEEDELDLDILEGTAIAGTRFDWIIQQLRR
ncbi:cyclic nucleotide-binding domain-containing protein [Cyanobacteria bacterium FACHB-DQ100]|uniref:cyclic nucleotide-binding domain-containing protein n=1 Tax=Leptolyngbya sp. DQ-M1 TaxID=2933920 RepID=UPI001996B108|nr:cyclic nucleotide-binding domain-containing protein [Cyanobacteria bacterium FACHB-DQ100]